MVALLLLAAALHVSGTVGSPDFWDLDGPGTLWLEKYPAKWWNNPVSTRPLDPPQRVAADERPPDYGGVDGRRGPAAGVRPTPDPEEPGKTGDGPVRETPAERSDRGDPELAIRRDSKSNGISPVLRRAEGRSDDGTVHAAAPPVGDGRTTGVATTREEDEDLVVTMRQTSTDEGEATTGEGTDEDLYVGAGTGTAGDGVTETRADDTGTSEEGAKDDTPSTDDEAHSSGIPHTTRVAAESSSGSGSTGSVDIVSTPSSGRPSSSVSADAGSPERTSSTEASSLSDSSEAPTTTTTTTKSEHDITFPRIRTARIVLSAVFLAIGLIAVAVLAVCIFKEKRKKLKYDQLALLP